MNMHRGEARDTSVNAATAEATIDRVSKENSGVLVGEEANVLYMEYLRSGGNPHELGEALVQRSNETTAREILGDLIKELL